MNMVKIICKICGKEVEAKSSRRLYCSDTCQEHNYYLNHKEKIKEYVREWEKNNKEKTYITHKKSLEKFRTNKRERFNELMRKVYHRNKDKWRARNNTKQLLNQVRNPVEISKVCKLCGSKDNLSRKFEIYPRKFDEIRAAIKNKQIYYICRDCRKKNE